jgi:uncharacterized Zn finger protein
MAIKFRLKGLAETFIENIICPECGIAGNDDEHFSTELTKVTLEGIAVILQCKNCGEIFVPHTQRIGILNPRKLKLAVEKDAQDTGEALLANLNAVKITAEKLNAEKKGKMH